MGSSSKQRKRAGMNTKPTLEDAVRYLKAVVEKLDEKTAKTFFHMWKDFQEDRIDAYEVITKVYKLLKGHPDLLEGFNAFLPKYFDPFPILRNTTQEDVASLILRVEWRFRPPNGQVYNMFMVILSQYLSMQKTADVVCQEMRILFQGHKDLFQAFKKYLPADTPGLED